MSNNKSFHSSIKNQNILSFQTVIVIKKVQTVLHVTINMENVTVIQTFQAKSVTNVLMVSMNSQTVKVGFSYQYFINSVS